MSTQNVKKRKRIVHRQETYLRWYDEVKQLHKFSFRKRKEFTPAQKTAITRQYRKHRETLEKLSNGRGIFKKTTKSQNRALKRSKIATEGFIVTNQGIYVPGVRTEKVKAGRQKVSIVGKGKSTKVRVQLPARKEEFFPYIEAIHGTFQDFVKYLIKKYKPDDLYIQNESGRGLDRYEPKLFLRYVDRTIEPRIKVFKKRFGIDRNPFTGVWLVWYKFR